MNVSKIKNVVFLFSILTILVSCQDEELTPGEVTGKKIESLKKQKDIKLCSVDVNDVLYEINETFRIEGQFLVTGSEITNYYDLNKLILFQITESNDESYILFHFFE